VTGLTGLPVRSSVMCYPVAEARHLPTPQPAAHGLADAARALALVLAEPALSPLGAALRAIPRYRRSDGLARGAPWQAGVLPVEPVWPVERTRSRDWSRSSGSVQRRVSPRDSRHRGRR